MFAFPARRYGGVVAVVALVGSFLVGPGPAVAAAHGKKPSLWTTSAAVLPTNDALRIRFSTLTSETCPAPGSCVAVGSYLDARGGQRGLIDTLAGGTWTPETAPLPANAASDPGADVTSVTCVSTDACVAVGGYSAKKGQESGLVETFDGSTWTPKQVLTRCLGAPLHKP